jgi:hypothetical protein
MDNFYRKQLISEGHKKVKNLKETRPIVGFTGAFSAGCCFAAGDTWLAGLGGFFFWFCIWAYYKIGLHTDSINEEIKKYEKHGEEKEGDYLHLQYLIECSMKEILIP